MAATDTRATVYVADAPDARLTVPLDGLTLVYHRASRTTHLLASPAPELLAALADGPADAATLVARLVAAHGLAAGEAEAAEDAVAARLAELAAAGLVAAA